MGRCVGILCLATLGAGCAGSKGDSGNAATVEDGAVRWVTVGAYQKDGDDYVDRNADLTYEVGASCQIWSRTAQEHGSPPEPGHEGVHDHWNAADGSTYGGGVFTWTEYGPYLTESEVAESCAGGVDPSEPKSVTADAYTEFQPGLYLRIKSVE